jgi:hypothetical protein
MQQLWGYKVKEKLNLGVREQKGLNTTAINNQFIMSALFLHVLLTNQRGSTG